MNYPIKLSFKSELLPVLCTIAAFVFGTYFYARFPEQIVSHWNFYGEPDGYSGKFFGSYGIPIMMIGMYFLFLLLPFLDPKKDRYPEFEKPYHIFRSVITLVLFVVFLATGFFNLGYGVSIQHVVPTAIGVLMLVIGNYMGKLKKNWFFGVRTPWTLSSENVWNKTHRFGGWAFVLFGVIIIIVPFLSMAAGLIAFIAGITLITLGTILYSYIEYKKEQRG